MEIPYILSAGLLLVVIVLALVLAKQNLSPATGPKQGWHSPVAVSLGLASVLLIGALIWAILYTLNR